MKTLRNKNIVAQLINAKNDVNGNPRRLYNIFDSKMNFLGVIDDAYSGTNFAIGRKVRFLNSAIVTAKFYRESLKFSDNFYNESLKNDYTIFKYKKPLLESKINANRCYKVQKITVSKQSSYHDMYAFYSSCGQLLHLIDYREFNNLMINFKKLKLSFLPHLELSTLKELKRYKASFNN